MAVQGGDGPSLEVDIANFLRMEQPYTYCDACLAFVLRLDAVAVRQAATSIATDSEVFERVDAECDQCDRFGLMTCAR